MNMKKMIREFAEAMSKFGNWMVEKIESFASARTYRNLAITFGFVSIMFFSFYQLALIDSWSIRPLFLWLTVVSLILIALAAIGWLVCFLSDNSLKENLRQTLCTGDSVEDQGFSRGK